MRVEKPVGDGVSSAHYLALTAVGKSATKNKYVAANEFICARIGEFIGLPIPPFGMFNRKGSAPDIWFGSLDLRREGETLPQIVPSDFVEKFNDVAAGVIMFDVWIANADRHENNLGMADGPAGADVFDHSHALMGMEGVSRLDRLRRKFGIVGDAQGSGNRHCLLDHVRNEQRFEKWISRISETPSFLIEKSCGVMLDLKLLTEHEVQRCTDFLKFRQKNIRRLIHENRSEFTSINSWDLFLWQIKPWSETDPDLWGEPDI